jgi:hypothetical protein
MMTGRFDRAKVGGVSPFFAFQDIITSAMAVLITVVMLLALNIGSPAKSTAEDPAPESLQREWQRIMEGLTQATTQLRDAEDAVAAAKLDPAMLQGKIDDLRAELEALHAQSETSGNQLTEAKRHDGATVVWSELEKEKAAIKSARAHLTELEDKDQRSRDAMSQAEEAMRAKESQLLAEQKLKNEIFLIPDRSKTTKEPVLAIVTADSVILERFDHPETTEIRGFGLRSKFEKALEGYSKLDQYIVFYFKPSGVENFDAMIDAAKTAGFEIGYDGVNEDVTIHFGSGR